MEELSVLLRITCLVSRHPAPWRLARLLLLVAVFVLGFSGTGGAGHPLSVEASFPIVPRATPDGSEDTSCPQLAPIPPEQPAEEEDDAEAGGASGEVAEQLPPADLPTTNVQGLSFRLESTLTVGFTGISSEAPVYRLVPPAPTAEATAALAERLGIDGQVDDRGGDTFVVSGNGDLFVTPTLIQYISAEPTAEGDPPGDEEAVALARDWLREACLFPPDLGTGTVVSRTEESARVVVLFTPVEPELLLAAHPSITVSLGPDGTVLEASSRWASILRDERYQLRPAEDAWRQIERGEGFIEATFGEETFPQGAEVVGTAEYTSIEIGYTTAGLPGEEQFLEPVFVFSGRVTPEGGDQSYPARAFVPALADSGSPVGVSNFPSAA